MQRVPPGKVSRRGQLGLGVRRLFGSSHGTPIVKAKGEIAAAFGKRAVRRQDCDLQRAQGRTP